VRWWFSGGQTDFLFAVFFFFVEFTEQLFGKITNFSNATNAASFATHNRINASTIN
jgi:hypothetical protein